MAVTENTPASPEPQPTPEERLETLVNSLGETDQRFQREAVEIRRQVAAAEAQTLSLFFYCTLRCSVHWPTTTFA